MPEEMKQDVKQDVTPTVALTGEVSKMPVLQEAEARALNFLNPTLLGAMKNFAETMVMSKAFPQELNAAKIMVALQAGYEIGLTPIESVNSFYFVNGRVAIFGETAIAQVQKRGHSVEFTECDDQKATCTITRGDNGKSLSHEVTMDKLVKRGVNNPVMRKYPENFLKFKAFHMTAKFICPEVFHNIPLKEELDEMQGETQVVQNASGKKHRMSPLEADLEQLDETAVIENEPVKKGMRKTRKASVVVEAEAQTVEPEMAGVSDEKAQEPQTEPVAQKTKEESDKEMYDACIEKEINGETLTPREKMFVASYQTRSRKSNV